MVKVDDLLKERKVMEDDNKKLYKKIYKLIETQIIINNRQKLNYYYYEISLFYYGMPLYSINDCVKYVTNKFKKNGFNIEIKGENGVYVTW